MFQLHQRLCVRDIFILIMWTGKWPSPPSSVWLRCLIMALASGRIVLELGAAGAVGQALKEAGETVAIVEATSGGLITASLQSRPKVSPRHSQHHRAVTKGMRVTAMFAFPWKGSEPDRNVRCPTSRFPRPLFNTRSPGERGF